MRSQAPSESKCRLRTDKLGVNRADSIGVQAPRCHHLEVLMGCLETLWAANRAPDVFFDPLPPDSVYGGGAFSTFFPTCVSSSGPWAPSFPLASCLGLGQLGAGEGGLRPRVLLFLALSILGGTLKPDLGFGSLEIAALSR